MTKKNTKTTKKPTDPTKNRVVLCEERDSVKVSIQSNGHGDYRTKTLPRGVVEAHEIESKVGLQAGALRTVMRAIQCCIVNGQDVRLDGIYIGVAVNPTTLKPFPFAKTTGEFRQCLSDKGVRPFIKGKEVSPRAAKSLIAKGHEVRRRLACVTPDTMVECPKCGEIFRVGKVLASAK